MPAYLPAPARTLIPWARRYAAQTARRAHLSLEDTWDEALTALVRAAVYFQPGAGSFTAYARTAVIRGLWRYCRRPARARAVSDWLVPPTLAAPSAETVAALAELATASVVDELARAAPPGSMPARARSVRS